MSGPKSRTEVFREPVTRYQWRGLPGSSPSPGNIDDTLIEQASGKQDLLLSSGHPYRRLGKDQGDIGGNFCVVRREYYDDSRRVYHNRTVTNENNALASNYKGCYFAQDYSVTTTRFPGVSLASDNQLDVLGTQAIRMTAPTNPIAGLLVFLGELRSEGLPALHGVTTWKDRTSLARSAGSEYLNHQFGWLPLVSDVRKFAYVVSHADELVQRYVREAGNLLHRTYTFPSTYSTNTVTETGVYPQPAFVTGYWNSSGTRTTTTSTLVEQWFEGTYTYHLPPEGTLARHAAIANKLLGTRITPEVLWNLTPWSWAADWFGSVGDVLHNISAFQNDGLVMPYAYIMQKRTVKRTVTMQGARTKRNNLGTDCQQIFTTVVKQRRKATPYGFGLTYSGFSTKQKAIIAALGLSRGSSGMKYE